MADLHSFLENVSVLNEVPELGTALDDNDIPVSGYIHEQITKLSLKSANGCDQLLHYLLGKIKPGEPLKTKLKALKLMKFLVVNGNHRFRQNLRKNEWLIKDETGASEVIDPIYGNSVSSALRTTAKELLHALYENFDDDHHVSDEAGKNSQTYTSSAGTGHLGGMGSNRVTGEMEGFGNTPKNTSTKQTTMSKMMDGLSDVLDKLLNPPNASIQSMPDVGGYEAVSLPPRTSTSDPAVLSSTTPSLVRLKPVTSTSSNRIVHIPGRAGGGWDDDDVCRRTAALAGSRRRRSGQSVISQDSLDKMVTGDPTLSEAEKQLVDEITNRPGGATGELQPFRSVLELDNLCRRCSSLNCDKMVELLHKRLVDGQEDVVKMRILMMIEAFVNGDVVHVDGLFATFEDTLRQLQNTDSNDLKVKSTKILLILQRLQQCNDGPVANILISTKNDNDYLK